METLLSPLWLTLPFMHWLNHKKGVGEIQWDNIAVIKSLRRHKMMFLAKLFASSVISRNGSDSHFVLHVVQCLIKKKKKKKKVELPFS